MMVLLAVGDEESLVVYKGACRKVSFEKTFRNVSQNTHLRWRRAWRWKGAWHVFVSNTQKKLQGLQLKASVSFRSPRKGQRGLCSLCLLIPETAQNQPPARLPFGHAPCKSLLKTGRGSEALRSIEKEGVAPKRRVWQMAFGFPLRVSGEAGLSRVSAGDASRPPSASQDQMCLGLRGKRLGNTKHTK